MKSTSKSAGLFIVCGTTNGFGKAVAEKLMSKNHSVLGIARGKEELEKLQKKYPRQFEFIAGDLSQNETAERIGKQIEGKFINGIFINAGGPPAKTIEETSMEDWDQAYETLLRWKVDLVKKLLPIFKSQGYGRILFLESSSVKQPIENLVLSTSLRSAIVGFAKTLSEEIAHYGITVNVLAPGYHDTNALNRLIKKRSEELGITEESAKKQFKQKTKVGRLGKPENLGALAGWLLSPEAEYITGQTISVDGGVIKGTFG
jgi:3-oxoacyl-[acyl-carrier protein] reductase